MAILKSSIPRKADHDRKSWRGQSLLLAALLLGGAAVATAQSAAREYQLKSVFLFNFAQFVEWPAESFPDVETPFCIGILGDDPFGSLLDQTVQGERIGSRPLLVQRYRTVDEIDTCHILFISRSEDARLDGIVGQLRGRSILTVSDSEGAAQRGVMIRFVTENRKIRLRINLEAARTAQLTISSKLLRPAHIITTREDLP